MPTRTTLTLDDDVVSDLRAESRRTGRPFRRVVNEAIRAGLSRPPKPGRFRVQAFGLGMREGLELDDIAGLLDRVEGPRHR